MELIERLDRIIEIITTETMHTICGDINFDVFYRETSQGRT